VKRASDDEAEIAAKRLKLESRKELKKKLRRELKQLTRKVSAFFLYYNLEWA
jgi:hypothetical protein